MRGAVVCLLVTTLLVAMCSCESSRDLAYSQAIQQESEGDIEGACKILLVLSGAGDSRAQYELGRILINSNDPAQGIHYWLLAANSGHLMAMNSLAAEYATGRKCPKNLVEAYEYFGLTAIAHDPWGIKYQQKVSLEMTPSEIAEGNKRIATFLATHTEFREKYH